MLNLEKLQKVPVRQLRVAELIKEVVAESIAQEQVDAKVLADNFITVSKVKVSPDLQNATIFVSIFQASNVKEIIDDLNKLSYQFRMVINRNVKLRSSPKISFRYDDTLEEVDRIEQLIHSINKEES